MNEFIPLVSNPYPDELLYSWIIRLANINELHNRTFYELYLGEKDVKKRPIKIDIRRGYRNFYNALDCDEDMMELYFRMSTTSFELSFMGKRQQIKILHNIIRDEDELNCINNYFVKEPRVCLECMKEDIETYGEPYLHRAHHLTGIVACHKHHTPLYTLKNRKNEVNKNDIHYYDFKNITNKISDISEYDCKYADYVYELLSQNIISNSDDILLVIADKIKETTGKEFSGKQPLIHYIANLVSNTSEKTYARKTELSTIEFIKCLMMFFPSVDDFINKIPPHSLITKEHCKKCNCDFYAVPQALKDGWGCPQCDAKAGSEKLLKRIVKTISGGELELVKIVDGKPSKKLLLYNKSMNMNVTTNLTNLLYGNQKHYGTMRMSRREAEQYMKKYKHFQLIEYTGSSHPAKIYHDICGQTFELSAFGLFMTSPVCRCCETIKEFDIDVFKQQVKDIVGDEYEVLDYFREENGNLVNVMIKHKKCGTVKKYKPYNFLTGERCSKCSLLIRTKYLKLMLKEYSDGRYETVGAMNKQKIKILDTKTNKTFEMKAQQVVQEMLRPTPSPIFEFNNKERKQISSWDVWYELCKQYRQEFGHLCPQRGERYKGTLFSRWCEEKRQHYNKGLLTEEQIQQLQELDFVFNAVFYKWCKRFEEYKEYVKETGVLLPKSETIHNGNKVGKWVLGQRTERRKGKLNPVYEKMLLEYNPHFFEKRD